MKYALRILPSVPKAMRRIPAKVRHNIDRRILMLADDPRPVDCIRLSGHAHTYRVKVGRVYRVVYVIDDDRHEVTVRLVAHRRDVYRDL